MSNICEKCNQTLSEIDPIHLHDLKTKGWNNCLISHINKSKSDEKEWLKVVNFFLEMKLWITKESELEQAGNMAFGLPKLFFVYCLLPYVHEGMESGSINEPSSRDLGNKSFFSVVSDLTYKLIDGCGNNETNYNGLIDDLKRLIEHYSQQRNGELLLNSIVKGVCKSREKNNNGTNSSRHSFLTITDLRQAYWSNCLLKSKTKISADRTIRINGLPFAESAFIYYLSECAHNLGINLEIIDVPWAEVGFSLLNGSIDIAVHNKSLLEEQLPAHRRLAQNRILYCSKTILEYNHYSRLIHKNNPTNSNSYKNYIAIVKDSEQEFILREWYRSSEENRNAFRKDLGLPISVVERLLKFLRISKKVDDDEIKMEWILPVSDPDIGVSEFLDGGAAQCFVGGIHENYIQYEFSYEAKSAPLNKVSSVEVFFATLATNQKMAQLRLTDIISSWRQVHNNWNWVKNGVDEESAGLRKRIITHVNRQPHRAFISDFTALYKLLSNNNKLHCPDFDVAEKQVNTWL